MQRELVDQIARPLAWPRRFTVVALFFLATVLCYVDRVSISVAIIPLSRDRGYDGAAQGIVLSAFFWGDLWPQLLGGWMSDRFGGRRVLAAGVAVWSIATLLTPPASVAFSLLIAMRVLLGLGEGVNFPAIHSITARWTLAEERLPCGNLLELERALSRSVATWVEAVFEGFARCRSDGC